MVFQHVQGDVVGGGPRHADQPDADLRLCSAGLVDDEDLPLAGLRCDPGRERRGRGPGRLPGAEALIGERTQHRRGDVADHDQHRVVRPVVAAVEGAQLVDAERFQRRLGAARGGPVAMLGAEEQPREGDPGQRRRIVAGLQQRGQPLGLQPVELLRREVGSERHLGEQAERVGQLRRRRVHPHDRGIEGCAGGQLRAQELDFVGQRERGLAGGAFVEHRRGHAGGAELARHVGAGARQHHQVGLHQRHLVVLEQPHPQAVGRAWIFCTAGSFKAGAGPSAGGLERSGACCAASGSARATTRADRVNRRQGDCRHSGPGVNGGCPMR